MAKKRKRGSTYRGSTYEPQATRGHPVTATLPPRVRLPVFKPTRVTPLQLAEDRRTIPHDIRDARFVTVRGTPAEVSRRPTQSGLRQMRKTGLLPALFNHFEDARNVPVCIRRENRKRVLFALRKTGRGGRNNRRGRWTAKSFIRCK